MIGRFDDFAELCDIAFLGLVGVQFDELANCVDCVLILDFVGLSLF